MATNILKFDGSILTTVPDYAVDSTTASIIYIGKNVVGYGSYIQSNITRLMENFAGDNYPTNPLSGQIWFKKNTVDSSGNSTVLNRLRYYTGDLTKSSDGWIQLADQTDIDYLQNEITNMAGEIADIYSRLDKLDGEVSGLQTEVQNLQNELDTELANIGNKFLPTTGGTMTGSIIMSNSTMLQLDGTSATDRSLLITTGGSGRWKIAGNSDAETGGNNGTNYYIERYNDSGNVIDTPFQINRVDGVVYMNDVVIRNSLKIGSSTPATEDWANNQFVKKQNGSPDNNSYSGDLGSPNSMYQNIYSNYFHGIAIEAEYADIAERYEADAPYDYGTIVKIGGEKEITNTTKKFDMKVFGVISKNPSLLMNNKAGSDLTHPPVVLTGRSPVKVYGKVNKGDFIVTSNVPGVGISYEEAFDVNRQTINSLIIVGRALENYNSSDVGLIDCFIGK